MELIYNIKRNILPFYSTEDLPETIGEIDISECNSLDTCAQPRFLEYHLK